MANATVKIDATTYAKLKETATQTGRSMIEVLASAVEAYHRQTFLDALNADFDALRGNPLAWKEELTEREAWDSTLADGLEDD
ncbi:MAG: hypothetical protein ACLQNE_06160 [Thermoguttaceae bacterium]|jgi:hypothetical protein